MARRHKDEEKEKPRAAPAVRDESDDEAPEEFSKESAKEQALLRLQHEQDAREQAAQRASAKRKRQSKPKADAEAEKDEDEADAVDELPEDVLAAVAARHEEDEAEEVAEAARERTRKRHAALKKRQTHVREFGHVKVRTLESVDADAAQSRALSQSASAFLDRRAAPHRPRMNVLDGHPALFTKKQKERGQRA